MSDSPSTGGGMTERPTRSSYVAIQLHDAALSESTGLDWVPTRLRNSLGVSVGIHIVLGALFAWLLTLAPPTPSVAPRDNAARMVYLSIPGPGGGGGGGGNESPEPPRKLERPGPDALSIPKTEESPLQPPPEVEPPEPEPPEPPKVVMPVMPTASGPVELAGAIFEPPKATMSQGSGSDGGAGSGKESGFGPGEGSGVGPGSGGGTGGGVYRPGAGIEVPRKIVEIKPQYTAEAMRARIQGTVSLECIVTTDGACANIRVTRSLDSTFGLDQEAIKAAGQWEFEPGRRLKDGVPVPVLISIEMDFTLR